MDEKIKALFEVVKKQDYQKLEEFIKSHGNNLNYSTTNEVGMTLLHIASQQISHNSMNIIKTLLNLGVDKNAVDEKLKTALDYAKEKYNIQAITALS